MVSYLSRAANAVLFVAACFLAANTANAIFASMLTAPVPEQVARAEAPAVQDATWNDRQVILDRNLFNSSSADGAAALAPIDEDIEETQLPLRLLGTAAAEIPELAWAAVEDESTRDTLVVTIDDILLEKATVVRIERRRIVLLENDEHRELTFGDDIEIRKAVRSAASARNATRRPRPGSRREPNVRQLADNRFALPRGDVEEALRDPSDILSQARFLPKYQDGEMVGFQVNAIKSGSVLEEFGIKNGDLITEFNGISIDSPTESARLLQEFNESDTVELNITHNDGSTDVYTVELD